MGRENELNTAKIIATGSAYPKLSISNDDLSKIMDTTDEWIHSRTGIKNRRISTGETTLDLAYDAALNAFNKYNISVDSIDLIIVATVTGDYFMPSTACLLQGKLGIKNDHVTAFDINAACTGMIYAMQIAHKYISSGAVNRALVVGTDTMSKLLNWDDRGTSVLFGDGAGAVILEKSNKGILADYTNSLPDTELNLYVPGTNNNNPYINNQSQDNNQVLSMNGKEIFKFGTFAIKDSIDNLLCKSDLSIDDINYIIPHQANERIIVKASRMMNIPMEHFFLNLSKYGNTSAGSIGIALDELISSGHLNSGDKIILVGFGGGLTWGSILYEY